MNMVLVGAFYRIKTSVCVGRNFNNPLYRDVVREQGVKACFELGVLSIGLWVVSCELEVLQQIKMGKQLRCMNTAIGSAAT